MIDWGTAATVLAELVPAGRDLSALVDRETRLSPPLQNRPHWLPPTALWIDPARAAAHADAVNTYVALLRRVLALYRSDPLVRAYFGLSEAAGALMAVPGPLDGEVPVCRLDGYIDATTGEVKLLENNADAPAGTVFTPRVNTVVDRVRAGLGVDQEVDQRFGFADDGCFAELLLALAGRCSVGRDEARVAVLQPVGQANRESAELVALLARRGVEAFLADPRTVNVHEGRVRFAERVATVCWNKVNTASWQELVERDADVVTAWCRALASGSLVHVNPFGARYVSENKLALALLCAPGFAGHLTDEERRLVETHLPPGYRMGVDGRGDGLLGFPPELDPLGDQHQYVVKEHYDIRGDGVTVGRAASRGEWNRAVEAGFRRNLLLQRFVQPTAYPVLGHDGTIRSMSVSLDSFVFGHEFVGFGAKASMNSRVNVFQGGSKLAVRVRRHAGGVADREGELK